MNVVNFNAFSLANLVDSIHVIMCYLVHTWPRKTIHCNVVVSILAYHTRDRVRLSNKDIKF